MTDLNKIFIQDTDIIELIYNNPLLKDFNTLSKSKEVKKEGGGFHEIIQSQQTKIYKGVYFCFYENKLEILFKPHYYFNGNLHNANRFTALDSIKVHQELLDAFKIPLDSKILNHEYGINAISPIDAKDLITYATYHEKNEFKNSSDNLSYSRISSKHNQKGTANKYKMFKFYAKGLQFPEYADINTFRTEVKSKKTQYIKNQLKINTYADLLNPSTYLVLATQLKKEWNNVLILNPDFDSLNVSQKDIKKLTQYGNPFYWRKKLEESKNSFNRAKKRYYELLDKTDNNTHSKVVEIIDKELAEITKGCTIIPPLLEDKKVCHFERIYNANRHTLINSNHLNIDNDVKINSEYSKRVCLVTGLNISMQKEDSILLSHTGLNYYFNTDKKVFNEVKRKHLSDKWQKSNFTIQIKEIAHNIRNYKSNKEQKQRFIYPVEQNNLLNNFF